MAVTLVLVCDSPHASSIGVWYDTDPRRSGAADVKPGIRRAGGARRLEVALSRRERTVRGSDREPPWLRFSRRVGRSTPAPGQDTNAHTYAHPNPYCHT